MYAGQTWLICLIDWYPPPFPTRTCSQPRVRQFLLKKRKIKVFKTKFFGNISMKFKGNWLRTKEDSTAGSHKIIIIQLLDGRAQLLKLCMVKGTQAWIFLKNFLAETEILWSQGTLTRDFWKSYSIRPRYSTFKYFRVCSASDEIHSGHAQPAMKFVWRMLSVWWNLFRFCSACIYM